MAHGDDQIAIKAYLLGTLTDEAERRRIEESLLLDDDFAEMLAVAESELTEDYLDNVLDPGERKSFERFFLAAPERKRQLRLMQNIRKYASQNRMSPAKPKKERSAFKAFFARPWPVAAGFALVLLTSILGWFFLVLSSETAQVNASLDRAFRLQRPFAARVSDLAYAPFDVTRGDPNSQIDRRALEKAENIARDAALSKETAESLRNEGRVFLLEGNFDRAIESLEKARNLAPQNAAILNDLGAAQLEQGKSVTQKADGKGIELEAKALANFEKAVELDPKFLAAYFNKALCYQSMPVPAQARDAWLEYLKLDPSSPWAAEARKNLDLVNAVGSQSKSADQILQDFMSAYRARDDEAAYRIVSRNREMISGKLIPQQLANQFLNRAGPDRQEYLSALNYVGRLENEKSQDPYFSAIASYYSSASRGQLDAAQSAEESVNQGYSSCLHDDCKTGLTHFTNAEELFDRSGNGWEARLCDYWKGYSLFRLGKIDESSHTLNNLVTFAQIGGYKWLAAQALSWLAVNQIATKEVSKAIETNRAALSLSAQVSDLYLNEKVNSQLGDVYRLIGDYSQATDFVFSALEIAETPEASPRQKYRDYDSTADLFFAMRNYSAASAFKKESLELAMQLNDSSFLFTANIGLGAISGVQGKYGQAFGSFDKSGQIAVGFDNSDLKAKSIAYNQLETAHVQRQAGNCAAALKDYDDALAYFDSGRFSALSYDAHKGRLLCHYETRDDAAFEAELPVILNMFRDFRKEITEEQNRDIFFDNEQTVYDIAVAYEFDRSNNDKAFELSEDSRARSLLAMQGSPIEVSQKESQPELTLPDNATEPRKLSEIQAQMPVGVQLLQYSALADKTLIWLITRDSVELIKSDIAYADLQDKVSRYLALLPIDKRSSSETETELATDLYRYLITPIEKNLDARKEICFIPDKILFRLPFGALISPETGKYLISDHVIFTSPSASSFLISSDQAVQRGQNIAEKLLSIGNPSFNRDDFAKLEPLVNAGKEAQDVSLFYEHPTVLIEKDATKENVSEDLSQADVIHFAGHYLVDKSWPLLSGLVLAENATTHERKDSLLANHEIVGKKLSRTRLIVLSACETGVERFYNGEGMIGAARSFLATGVPLIVASQWNTDSEATATLMTSFHRYRKQGGLSTVEALRRSQLEMLGSENEADRNPYYWAAFETVGGYAEF